MKRKLFTLLLATVSLTAFQANAQDKRIRILADTSGLAKTSWLNSSEKWESRHDSFPRNKQVQYRWVSVGDDGKFKVKSAKSENDSTNRKELYGDPSSVFSLSFKTNTTDSTNFRFKSKDGAFISLGDDESSTSVFEIVQLSNENSTDKGKSERGGKFGKFVSYANTKVDATLGEETGGANAPRSTNPRRGYLASSPASQDSVQLDTIQFALVGADKAGHLSLKYFRDFAIYGDSLPYAPYWKYQYEKRFEKGKMYQSRRFPYFEIYDTDDLDGPKGFFEKNRFPHRSTATADYEITGGASNWGNLSGNKPNPNDPHVYTSLDIKLSGDSAIVLMDSVIRLDSIFYLVDTLSTIYLTSYEKNTLYSSGTGYKNGFFADSAKWSKRHWQGFGALGAPSSYGTKENKEAENIDLKKILKFGYADDSTRMRVYLKKETNGQLGFTVRRDSAGEHEVSSEWSNGLPTQFDFYNQSSNLNNKMEKRYYYIDTGWMKAFQHILLHFVLKKEGSSEYDESGRSIDSLRNVLDSIGPRYLYKNDNDSWRPIYVKLEDVPEAKKPAHYVREDWVKEHKYNISAALQTIIDAAVPSSMSKGDEATIVAKDDASVARFSFELADTIGLYTHWLGNSYYKNSGIHNATENSSTPYKENFQNTDSIELFHIIYDGKYLTALDSSDYLSSIDVSINKSVTNTQLGWRDKFTSQKEIVRQMFAIVRNYTDESVTFLPVASRKWQRDGNGTPKYNKSGANDTLSFNFGIGKYEKLTEYSINDSVAALTGTWHIYHTSHIGGPQKLVIADSSALDCLWLNLESALKPWNGHEAGKIASIKKVADGKYYRGDGERISDVTENDIRAHWRIDRKNIENNKWQFTPVIYNIYGQKQENPEFSKDSIYVYEEDGNIVLTDKDDKKVLDTVHVFYNINLDEGVSFFENVDKYAKTYPTVALTSVSGAQSERYVAFGNPVQGNDSIREMVLREHIDNDYIYLTLYKSNVQYLDTATASAHLYGRVPYYIFSHKDNNKEYFLTVASGDSVRWVCLPDSIRKELLGSTKTLTDTTKLNTDKYASFKFALPKTDGGNYLQALDEDIKKEPRVIKLKGDLSMDVTYAKAIVNNKTGEGVYGALDFYNVRETRGSLITWKVKSNGDYDEWVSIAEADSLGVLLAVDYSARYTYLGSKPSDAIRYGVLSDRIDPAVIALKLKRIDSEDVPAVEASQSIGISDEPTYYHIIQDSLYLTDNGDDEQVSFVDNAAERLQKFAFAKTGGEEGDVRFAIVSIRKADDYRYVSSSALDLIFSAEVGKALNFQWSKVEYTGIKAINASQAKVYGVAGGVKVANATGAVAIYTIDGRLVTTQAVTSPNRTIAVPAGIYIVRNGAEVTKVIVK